MESRRRHTEQIETERPIIKKLNVLFRNDDDSDEEDDNYDANDIDWNQEGVSAITENTYLKSICVNRWQSEVDDEANANNAKALLQAVSNNRSIRHFTMNGDIIQSEDMMEVLSPCLQHNNVLTFEVDCFDLTAKSVLHLSSALSKGKSLRKFTLDNSCGDVGDKLAFQLVASLESHTNLKELKLDFAFDPVEGYNYCIKLGNLLRQSLSKLEVLHLNYSVIDEKGAIALGSGLENSARLKKLSLRRIKSITSTGWIAIFQGLTTPQSSLEELDLYDNTFNDDASASLAKIKSLQSLNLSNVKSNSWRSLLAPLLNSTDSVLDKLVLRNSNIDDEGLTGLVDILGNNSSLRELTLGENRSTFTRAGMVSLIRYLGNPSSLLEHVDLSGDHRSGSIINDELAGTLASALRTNTKLKKLNLTNNYRIRPGGWLTFFNTLRNSTLSLEELCLSGNLIDDNGATSIANASASLCSLKVLRLSCNRFISPVGLRAISTLLQQPNSCLSELNVYVNDSAVNDEEVVNFANLLVGNLHLKSLYLGQYSHTNTLPSNLTSRGWDALANTLCNRSCIESIYDSNHTLESVLYSNNDPCLPPDLASFLIMNENYDNKFEVARQKIIQYHFLNGEDNTEEFLGMELGVIPHALGWTGRDDTGHSVLYQLVRCMPSLFELERMKVKATPGMKRKLDA